MARYRGLYVTVLRPIISFVAIMWTCSIGFAQDPAADSAAAPRIDLSAAQKQAIYQSVTKTQKNDPQPTGFRVAVGATVPGSITLAPVPSTIPTLMPQTSGLEVGRVEGQVILVDPKKKQVLSVITQEP
jgi:hypothetical protein